MGGHCLNENCLRVVKGPNEETIILATHFSMETIEMVKQTKQIV